MNKQIIIITSLALLIVGGLLYLTADKTTLSFSQLANKNVEPNQKFSSDVEMKVTSTDAKNVTASVSVDGPPHSNPPTSENSQIQNAAFVLDFFAGGSIFGSSFEVTVSDAYIMYREISQGGAKETKKIERSLLSEELDGLRKTVMDAGLMDLPSQNFAKEPLMPDQASYRITVSLDDKGNKIACGVPPSGTEPSTTCQKQIDILRLKLNSQLGVNIH